MNLIGRGYIRPTIFELSIFLCFLAINFLKANFVSFFLESTIFLSRRGAIKISSAKIYHRFPKIFCLRVC